VPVISTFITIEKRQGLVKRPRRFALRDLYRAGYWASIIA
jgi:hypothetical protein